MGQAANKTETPKSVKPYQGQTANKAEDTRLVKPYEFNLNNETLNQVRIVSIPSEESSTIDAGTVAEFDCVKATGIRVEGQEITYELSCEKSYAIRKSGTQLIIVELILND